MKELLETLLDMVKQKEHVVANLEKEVKVAKSKLKRLRKNVQITCPATHDEPDVCVRRGVCQNTFVS